VDETYQDYIWDGTFVSPLTLTDDWSSLVVLRSFSKTFAIPGWRVAFAVTTPERVEKAAVQHDALYIGGSTIAQYTLAAALEQYLPELNKYVSDLRAQLAQNRDFLAETFRDYGMEPLPVPATYYMLIKHHRKSDLAAVEELLAKKIVVTPANILYADQSQNTGYIRIHFAVPPETVAEVQRRLAR